MYSPGQAEFEVTKLFPMFTCFIAFLKLYFFYLNCIESPLRIICRWKYGKCKAERKHGVLEAAKKEFLGPTSQGLRTKDSISWEDNFGYCCECAGKVPPA